MEDSLLGSVDDPSQEPVSLRESSKSGESSERKIQE